MFFSIISPQNPPKLVIWNTKIPTREQNFPTNGLLGGALRPPPAPPLASALKTLDPDCKVWSEGGGRAMSGLFLVCAKFFLRQISVQVSHQFAAFRAQFSKRGLQNLHLCRSEQIKYNPRSFAL